jgi:hypothetical protein
MALSICFCCIGLYTEIIGEFPQKLFGWFIAIIILHICTNLVMTLLAILFVGWITVIKYFIENKNINFRSKGRQYLINFIKVEGNYRFSFWAITGVILDWTFISLLLTASCPVLATIYGVSIVIQYFAANSIRKNVRLLVSKLDDPFDGEDENIDLLFSKLIE